MDLKKYFFEISLISFNKRNKFIIEYNFLISCFLNQKKKIWILVCMYSLY